jgi:hypothetical protein
LNTRLVTAGLTGKLEYTAGLTGKLEYTAGHGWSDREA